MTRWSRMFSCGSTCKRLTLARARAYWLFHIYAGPVVFRLGGILAEIMSLLLMWSEATIWVNLSGLASENLSVFGMLLRAADEMGHHSYLAIQIAAAIPLLWMCVCSTYTVFKLKIFGRMDLSGNKNTDPFRCVVYV
ncbi:MAG: hypothetical protein EOO65_04870 [Methanosarcinales archaeon]|nr:MAG: hypothetical protein EOO65_04870 [Methanosarcinales archaeon]